MASVHLQKGGTELSVSMLVPTYYLRPASFFLSSPQPPFPASSFLQGKIKTELVSTQSLGDTRQLPPLPPPTDKSSKLHLPPPVSTQFQGSWGQPD